ncbi:MAG: 16S rRNA (guanine(966)-N(2))-methyltransferase RsmD [bacterium]
MRIASGKFKGRKLVYPRAEVRPTKELTRQAIFNILRQEVEGAKVCDLFAGGGALGIEAVSRGAREAVFVEKSPVVLRYLGENLVGLDGVRVIRGDVIRVLPRLRGEDFQIVFADPPYLKGLGEKTVDLVFKHQILAVGGVLILEHSGVEKLIEPEDSEVVREEHYGESVVTFFRRCK